MASIARSYYKLAKPGIVYGNLLHVLAASLFAWAFTGFKPVAMIGVFVGMALVIASACVVNCIMDRTIDAKMDRTKKRPLPMGEVSIRGATVYAIILGVIGLVTVLLLANVVAFVCAAIGHFTYTVVYGYAKRHTWASTIIGTVPGAIPVLAGYAAIDSALPPAAWAIACVVLVWQLPHFYALSLFRRDDYAKSGLPLLSVTRPRATVVRHIIATAGLYVIVTVLALYTLVDSPLSARLIVLGAAAWYLYIVFTKERGTDAWARKVFGTSLYMPIVFLLSGVIAVALS